MRVLCETPKAGPTLRLSDGTVMFDVLDAAGNAVTFFFADLQELVFLAAEMLLKANCQGPVVPETELTVRRMADIYKGRPH